MIIYLQFFMAIIGILKFLLILMMDKHKSLRKFVMITNNMATLMIFIFNILTLV